MKTYDPREIVLTLNGQEIKGFRDEPVFISRKLSCFAIEWSSLTQGKACDLPCDHEGPCNFVNCIYLCTCSTEAAP